jgi:branched-chain amino acid transport system ATP-binding protein
VTLELVNVHAGYGEAMVLRDVSLVVPDGRIVALLGPNGAGKTTLLRVASGLVQPASGDVALDGLSVTGWPPYRLAQHGVCHIPEGRGVFPQLSVRENIVLQAPANRDVAALERACTAFPFLADRLSQRAGSMSGGQQQMLALARAYISSPRIVLLDEVSMGLAPLVVDEIFLFLEKLREEGAALLLVEQYVTRALELADYAYILSRGCVSFVGEPGELEDDTLFQRYMAG